MTLKALFAALLSRLRSRSPSPLRSRPTAG